MPRTTLAALALLLAAGPATASTLNTLPPAAFARFYGGTPEDALGGSFVADANHLDSFSLSLFGNGLYRAIVLGFAGGKPADLLWQSSDRRAPSSVGLVSFTTDLRLKVGASYLIGVDSGRLTDVPVGASMSLGLRLDDPLADGAFYTLFTAQEGWRPAAPGSDIAARVVMSDVPPVPVPASLSLMGFSLGALALLRRRRRS